MVFQAHLGGREARSARHQEDLAHVEGLAGVDEIEDALGAQLADPVAHGRQIGGGVEVASVRLLDDHRAGPSLPVGQFFEEHHLGALVFYRQSQPFQLRHHLRQLLVVGAFWANVGGGEGDVEQAVDLLRVGDGDGDEALPEGAAMGIARLEADDVAASPLGEGGIFVEVALGALIKAFEVGKRQLRGLSFPEMFLQFGDEHAELGAPVAHVVLPDHTVAQVFQDARLGVPENGAAQVADVHFLGQVGGGVVDHHRLGVGMDPPGQGQLVALDLRRPPQKGVVEPDVDESRPGHLHPGGDAVQIQAGDDLLGEGARPGTESTRRRQGAIGLVVAEIGTAGRCHLGLEFWPQSRRRHRLSDPLGKQLAQGHGQWAPWADKGGDFRPGGGCCKGVGPLRAGVLH
ncbi:MAG: hypothetical protein KatS3mg124_0990 [Porticoccaceae bacterium]|nr:MAG: hypothetical protein KatS3mg124_0990 [Porticoccaceae bacterium]